MELKNCPFCENKISEHKEDCYFTLLKTNARGGSVFQSDLDAAWNHRAGSAALAAQTRELRWSLQYCKDKAHKPELIYQITKTALTLPDLSTEPLERYRDAVIEECAKVCAEVGQDWPAMYDMPHPEYCANKIRALKKEEKK